MLRSEISPSLGKKFFNSISEGFLHPYKPFYSFSYSQGIDEKEERRKSTRTHHSEPLTFEFFCGHIVQYCFYSYISNPTAKNGKSGCLLLRLKQTGVTDDCILHTRIDSIGDCKSGVFRPCWLIR
jgi:hypothetical protein